MRWAPVQLQNLPHLPPPLLCMMPGNATGLTAAPGSPRARALISTLRSKAPCMPLASWLAIACAAHTSAAQAAYDARPCCAVRVCRRRTRTASCWTRRWPCRLRWASCGPAWPSTRRSTLRLSRQWTTRLHSSLTRTQSEGPAGCQAPCLCT